MRLVAAFAGACCSALFVAAPAHAANVSITVAGVRDGDGVVRVALCDQPNFPSGKCPYRAEAPARAGSVTIRLADVLPGRYGAAAYHDERNLGHLTFTLLGSPKQGVGFSRGAVMSYGPPAFADASVAVGDRDVSITVTLLYPDT